MDAYIKALVNYALSKNLIEKEDCVYCTNALLALLHKNEYDPTAEAAKGALYEILNALCDEAVKTGLIHDTVTERDLFDTALMGVFTARPGEVIRRFDSLYKESPVYATDWFYAFSKANNYIREDRVAKILKWQYEDENYGTLDITVNLSKPEKDPKEIAAAKNAPQSGYPKCQLCRESEGYAGTLSFPARQNHRVIPLSLLEQPFYFQYSPYTYFNEHCIVLNAGHIPMVINKECFDKLLAFTALYPHYFLGSNADLPIVGGSILTHEHFQGGRYEFAMERAPMETPLTFKGFENVKAGIVKWPLSTIRLLSADREAIARLAEKILKAWRGYTDKEAFILAETDGVPHNTVTPIARRRGEKFELDLVLRNNITTDEHKLGVYHPHDELHHIKKENIGLIEVMGLAVLPARLKTELAAVANALVHKKDMNQNPLTQSHAAWGSMIAEKYPDINESNVNDILRSEVGKVFSQVLECAGVFKRNAEGLKFFMRFVESVS